jgi:uncharacterized iron-regulated membrane protein
MTDEEIESIERQQAEASKRWRNLWRIHFYSGIIAAPFLVMFALTGLVILYTQPIQDGLQSDVRRVEVGNQVVSYDEQAATVESELPDDPVVSMTPPREAGASTIFGLDSGRSAFVDPYSGRYLGSSESQTTIVRWANAFHGTLNNDSVTIPLPTVSALWDGDKVMRDYVVGDLLLELAGTWLVILALTGLYLFWPRRSREEKSTINGKRMWSLRLSKKGRARWRDLHALPGAVLFVMLLFVAASGLPWSTYWGPNFTALANEISPNSWTDAPASSVGTKGDLDRLGNQINWNTGDIPIPASYRPDEGAEVPAPLSLDAVVEIARLEGMKPDYTIYFPGNGEDDVGNPLYGSFTLSNSWPRKTGEARDVFIDQFDGSSLGEQAVYGYGSVSRAVDTTVSIHMGTQWGIVSRILMTLTCVLTLWSVVSAVVMYTKRRRKGTLGLPRRPAEVHLGRGLIVIGVVMGIVYPQWGASALLILGFDKFLIQRNTRLKTAFGQRT